MTDLIPAWADYAPCRNLGHLFFPNPGTTKTSRAEYAAAIDEARSICAGCPYQEDCREFAILIGARDGVWAGIHLVDRTLAAALAALNVEEEVTRLCHCRVCNHDFVVTRPVSRLSGRLPTACSDTCRHTRNRVAQANRRRVDRAS